MRPWWNTLLKWIAGLALALLIAMFLFPVLFAHREHIDIPSCASHEKQLGLALIQYVQDNDERYPPGPKGTGEGWAGPIYPYVKSASLFKCPDDATEAKDGLRVVSYAYNQDVARTPDLAGMTKPQATVLLFEVQGVNTAVDQMDEGRSQGATQFSPAGDGTDATLTAGPGNHPKSAWDRHSPSGSNILFGDGHVKMLPQPQISVGPDAARASNVASGKTPYRATFSIR